MMGVPGSSVIQKFKQKIQEEGIHHSKEINKKNKPEAFSEATQDEIDK